MSKYIIEIPDDVQYVLLNGQTDNKCYTAVRPVAELEVLNSDYINEHFGSLQDEAYQAGLNDAWEAAKRIVVDTDHGGLALGPLSGIFGTQGYTYIMTENTAQQAIDKINAYDDGKQKDRIEVGDEVQAPRGKAIITAVKDDFVHYFYSDGDIGCIEPYHVTKTGKHYDIQSILEAMRE